MINTNLVLHIANEKKHKKKNKISILAQNFSFLFLSFEIEEKINTEAVSTILFLVLLQQSTINSNPTIFSLLSLSLFSFSNFVALGAINAPLYIFSFIGTAPLYQIQIQILLQKVIIHHLVHI